MTAIDLLREEFKDEIRRKNKSMQWVSLRAGLNRNVVNRFLKGKYTPSPTVLEKLADAIGMKPVICLVEKE